MLILGFSIVTIYYKDMYFDRDLGLGVSVSVQTEDETVLWWGTVGEGGRDVQGGVRLVGDDQGGLGCPDSPGWCCQSLTADHSPAGGCGPQGLAHH